MKKKSLVHLFLEIHIDMYFKGGHEKKKALSTFFVQNSQKRKMTYVCGF